MPQSRSGHSGEEKNSQPPPRIEPWTPDHPVCSRALYLELSRLTNRKRPFIFNSTLCNGLPVAERALVQNLIVIQIFKKVTRLLCSPKVHYRVTEANHWSHPESDASGPLPPTLIP
jgi:hypothetical protein